MTAEQLKALATIALEAGWCLAIPNSANEDEPIKGVIVGTSEYVDQVLAHLDATQFSVHRQ